MTQNLSYELNELANALAWLGKPQESTIVRDIASKCAFYKIEELKHLDKAMSHYSDFRRAAGAEE